MIWSLHSSAFHALGLSSTVAVFFHGYIFRFGQDCMYTPNMTVYLVLSLPKLPYIHHLHLYIWFWPTLYISMCTSKITYRVYMHMYAHTSLPSTRVNTTRTFTHAHTHLHNLTRKPTHTQAHTHSHTQTHTHTYIHTHSRTHIHTLTHTLKHTLKHTHTHTCRWRRGSLGPPPRNRRRSSPLSTPPHPHFYSNIPL